MPYPKGKPLSEQHRAAMRKKVCGAPGCNQPPRPWKGEGRHYQHCSEEHALLSSREAHLKRAYGLSLEQYDAILEAQGGRCAICGSDDPHVGRRPIVNGYRTQTAPAYFAVDHDHATGKVRGLLCSRCNRALGGFQDDLHTLLIAVAYLEENR